MFRKIAMALHLGSDHVGGLDPMVINIIRDELGEPRLRPANVTTLPETTLDDEAKRKAA